MDALPAIIIRYNLDVNYITSIYSIAVTLH